MEIRAKKKTRKKKTDLLKHSQNFASFGKAWQFAYLDVAKAVLEHNISAFTPEYISELLKAAQIRMLKGQHKEVIVKLALEAAGIDAK